MAMFKTCQRPTVTDSAVSGAVANFNTILNVPLKSHEVAIVASQSGSGTPSPTNVRPITVYSQAVISQSGADTSTPTTNTIPFGQTVAGGVLDVKGGVITVTHGIVTLDNSNVPNAEAFVQYNSATDVYSWTYDHILVGVTDNANTICDKLSYSADAYNRTSGGKFYNTAGLGERIYVSMDGLSSKHDMLQWLWDNTPTFIYKLATPTTIQLTPLQLSTLIGDNNIWADTGDTSLEYYDLPIARSGEFREVFKLPTSI